MSSFIRRHSSKLALLLSAILLFTAAVGGTLAYVVTKTPSLHNTFFSDRSGALTMKKTVAHPFGADYTVPDGIAFDFILSLGEAFAGRELTLFTADAPEGTAVTADAAGSLSFSLQDGHAVRILDIPAGTEVTVTEQNVEADGFTVEGDASRTVTLGAEGAELLFTNLYTPAPAPAALTVSGTKLLEGREWAEGDSFTFLLEAYGENGEWEKIGTAEASYKTVTREENGETVTLPDPDMGGFLFEAPFLSAEGESMFREAGTYSFRIREEAGDLPGVLYDAASYPFDVRVGDADMDGALEIRSVNTTAAAGLSVSGSAEEGFLVSAAITNQYAPGGFAQAKITVKKQADHAEGFTCSPANFTFELYDPAGALAASALSSSTGDAEILLVYGAEDAGKRFDYILKEKNEGLPGWTYDDTEYPITVEVFDRFDGTVAAVIGPTPQETPSAQSDDTEPPEQEPNAQLAAASIPLPGAAMTVNLRYTPAAAQRLYMNTAPGEEPTPTPSAEPTPTPVEEPAPTPSEEPAPSPSEEPSPTPSAEPTPTPSEEPSPSPSAEPTPTPDTDASVSFLTPGGDVPPQEPIYSAVFTNTYAPAPAAGSSVAGSKTLTGRPLKAGEFTFSLREIKDDGTLGREVLTATNDAQGTFALDMTSLTFAKPGVYRFAASEEQGELGGIAYDETRYFVTVTVTDEGGVLKAATAVTDALGAEASLAFTNTYAPAKTAFSIRGEKALGGDPCGEAAFAFSLAKAADGTGTARDGNILETVTLNGAGSFAFTAIEYTAAGEYFYLVEEVQGTLPGMAYDSTVYLVTVTVTDDGNGSLTAAQSAVKAGSGEAAEVLFTNTYTAPAATPTPTPGTTPTPTPGASATPGITPTPTPGASATPGITPTPAATEAPPPSPGTTPAPTLSPSGGSSAGDKVDSVLPPTGDTNPIALYTVLMCVSAAAIVLLLALLKKGGREEQKRTGREEDA